MSQKVHSDSVVKIAKIANYIYLYIFIFIYIFRSIIAVKRSQIILKNIHVGRVPLNLKFENS